MLLQCSVCVYAMGLALSLEQLSLPPPSSGMCDLLAVPPQTQRTAFQCLQKFQVNNKQFKRSEWTPKEDQMLSQLVQEMRVGNHIPYRKSKSPTPPEEVLFSATAAPSLLSFHIPISVSVLVAFSVMFSRSRSSSLPDLCKDISASLGVFP